METEGIQKKPFYFTFGQRYAREEHPSYPLAHPNGWVTIVAKDWETARRKAEELFTHDGQLLFSHDYDDSNFESEYFPMGEIERFEV